MKFDTGPSLSQSGYVLSATPDDNADGYPPISTLQIDTVVNNLSTAKQAVAGCLAFGDYVGQEVLLTKPIPRMAQVAILEFFGDRSVFAHPANDTPVKVWPSSGSLVISSYSDSRAAHRPNLSSSHTYSLELADGSMYNGVFSSPHGVILASNAQFMASLENARFDLAGLQIAVGVMLSEDLHLRNLHLCAQLDNSRFERYKALLRAVELNLTTD